MADLRLNPHPSAKLMLGYVYTVGMFALTAFFGVAGPGDFADSETSLQRACSVAVTGYGILGLLGIIGLLIRHPWTPRLAAFWGVLLTAAAVLAPNAWAPEDTTWLTVVLGALIAVALAFTVYRVVRWLIDRKRNTEIGLRVE